jgi:cytochrome P450 monooxygenase
MPGRLPVLGHMPAIARDALGTLSRGAERCGELFWIDMGFGSNILLTLHEDGLQLFKNRYGDSSHVGELVDFLHGTMLTIDGKEHRRVRGASSAPFTPAGLTQARVGEIVAEVLQRRLPAWGSKQTLPVLAQTKEIALDVIFQVMGIEPSRLPQWTHHYEEYLLSAINIPIDLPGFPKRRARKARAWLTANIAEIIEGARKRGDRDSLVGAMAHGKDEEGQRLSDEELFANLLLLGFAGHETTASTMAWMMLHLAHDAAVWERLCDEANSFDAVPRSFKELVATAPIAEAIFRESLRLYPPVNIDSRRTHTEFEFLGHTIPVGTIAGCSILHISRNPDRYPEPETWKPERWLSLGHKPSQIENCQFGGGPHFCLGYHMALLEGTMFIVEAARQLSAQGLRPRPRGDIPKPRYIPLTRPPGRVSVDLS